MTFGIHTRLHAILLLIAALVIWLGGLFWFTRDLSNVPATSPTTPKDAIVVLTGGSNRLQTGFAFFEKGLGKKMFISGVYRGVDVKELMKLWGSAPQQNLDCCVSLGDAENTIGNARESTEWLKDQKFHSIYLITANYHMRRALLEFRSADHLLEITPIPVMPDGVNVHNWWREDMSRNLIIREYCKYILALIRYAITL